MGLRSWLFGDGADGEDEDERPPKPELDDYERVHKWERYEATVEYRNGDVETFECYDYRSGESFATFLTEPRGELNDNTEEPFLGAEKRQINYETLGREPVLEQVGIDTITVTAETTPEWKYQLHLDSCEWVPKVENPSVDVDRGAK